MSNENDLYELPNGWEWVTINEIISKDGIFIDGDWVESKDQDPNGNIRLIGYQLKTGQPTLKGF